MHTLKYLKAYNWDYGVDCAFDWLCETNILRHNGQDSKTTKANSVYVKCDTLLTLFRIQDLSTKPTLKLLWTMLLHLMYCILVWCVCREQYSHCSSVHLFGCLTDTETQEVELHVCYQYQNKVATIAPDQIWMYLCELKRHWGHIYYVSVFLFKRIHSLHIHNTYYKTWLLKTMLCHYHCQLTAEYRTNCGMSTQRCSFSLLQPVISTAAAWPILMCCNSICTYFIL